MLGFLERAFAKRMNLILSEPFGEFMETVEPQKKITPGKPLRVRGGRQIALVNPFGIKLVEINIVAKRPSWLVMIDDSQRHEHRTAPGTHFVEVHIEPFADEDYFAGDRRDILPRKKSQQREV